MISFLTAVSMVFLNLFGCSAVFSDGRFWAKYFLILDMAAPLGSAMATMASITMLSTVLAVDLTRAESPSSVNATLPESPLPDK